MNTVQKLKRKNLTRAKRSKLAACAKRHETASAARSAKEIDERLTHVANCVKAAKNIRKMVQTMRGMKDGGQLIVEGKHVTHARSKHGQLQIKVNGKYEIATGSILAFFSK